LSVDLRVEQNGIRDQFPSLERRRGNEKKRSETHLVDVGNPLGEQIRRNLVTVLVAELGSLGLRTLDLRASIGCEGE
jgi:hypothetical protein